MRQQQIVTQRVAHRSRRRQDRYTELPLDPRDMQIVRAKHQQRRAAAAAARCPAGSRSQR